MMTEGKIDEIANACRTKFRDWIDTGCSSGRKSAKPWMEDMKNTYIHIQLDFEDRLPWRDALQLAIKQMEPKWPDAKVRHEIESKFLKKAKSPDCPWLMAKAYMWLLHLKTNPPKNSSWFPAFAVQVAHKVFRLLSELRSFINYLTQHSRRSKLKSIPIPAAGLVSFAYS